MLRRRLIGWAAIVAIMCGLGVVAAELVRVGYGAWSMQWSNHWAIPLPKIRTIEWRGLRRLPVEELRQRLPFREGEGLLSAPLRSAAQRLATHPWVASATLNRLLPDRVVVHVVERQPVAVMRDREDRSLCESSTPVRKGP